MPRLRVVVLSQDPNNSTTYNVLFWADVPTARQAFYANAAAKSAWAGATTTDDQALQSGAVAETTQTHAMPSGTTLAQAEAYLQARWQDYQNFINNNNPWAHYGSTWDGATWTIATVS